MAIKEGLRRLKTTEKRIKKENKRQEKIRKKQEKIRFQRLRHFFRRKKRVAWFIVLQTVEFCNGKQDIPIQELLFRLQHAQDRLAAFRLRIFGISYLINQRKLMTTSRTLHFYKALWTRRLFESNLSHYNITFWTKHFFHL